MHFRDYINEQANTLGSDVNEIMFGYFILGGTWQGFQKASEAKKHVGEMKAKIDDIEYGEQIGRAEIMANNFLKWIQNNGYINRVKKVWWTGKTGELGRVMKMSINSKKNPTDILIQFTDDSYLGVSAKSSRKTNPSIKSPGVGTLDKGLNIHPTIKSLYVELEKEIIEKYDLPKTAKGREVLYQKDKSPYKKLINHEAQGILEVLRNRLLEVLRNSKNEKVIEHLRGSWMNVKDALYPSYIVVRGKGTGGKYSVSINNPFKTNMFANLMKGNLSFEPVGFATVGVLSKDGNKILKMRFKYGPGPLISLRMDGATWK